jgi:hypothetical protein
MMENQNKRFNDLVAKVKNGETTAPEAVWGKIESSLNKGNKRKAIYFWSLSVAMTILVASSSVYFFTNTVEKQNVLNASNLDKLEVKNDEGKRELQSPISKSQSKPELNPIYTQSTSPIENPERLLDDHKTSIENSELIADMLQAAKLPHQVLNAKQHASEATIIAQAGRAKMITIATNMAGRGTDIVLGGNVEKAITEVEADQALNPAEKQKQ